MKILFVCTANWLRSPTAAAVFGDFPSIEARSAGLNPACPCPLSAELIVWTDRLGSSINRECRSSFTDGAGSAIISAEFGSYLGNIGFNDSTMVSADPYYRQPPCTDRVNLLKTNQVSRMYEVLAQILANARLMPPPLWRVWVN